VDVTTPDEIGWKKGGAEPLGEFVPETDRAAIDASTIAIGIIGSRDAKGGKLAHDTALVAQEVAHAAHGWIFDLDTHLLHTPDSVMAHVPGDASTDVRKTVMLHGVTGDHDLAFVDTTGMMRIGLPELRVADVPQARINSVSRLLNATAQTLIERGDLTRDGQLEVDLSKLAGEWHVADIKKNGGTAKFTWLARWSRGDAPPDKKLDPDLYARELHVAGAKPGTAE